MNRPRVYYCPTCDALGRTIDSETMTHTAYRNEADESKVQVLDTPFGPIKAFGLKVVEETHAVVRVGEDE